MTVLVRSLHAALTAAAMLVTASAVPAVAQAPAPAPRQTARPAVNAQRYVAIGCVSRDTATEAGRSASSANQPRFLITDTRGDQPTVYILDGDAEELSFHVGHTIEVSGTLSPATPSTTAASKAPMTMKVVTLTNLSPKCGNTERL
jgi:hypothetical protein